MTEKTGPGQIPVHAVVMRPVPFELILEQVPLREIKTVASGPGWVGTRYVVDIYNEETSYPLETMADVRAWIVRKRGSQIECVIREAEPQWLAVFQWERANAA